MATNKTTLALINRIAESWSRAKDDAQPRGLEFEIQYQLGCSYGAAATIANEIRTTWALAEAMTMAGR